MMETLQNLVPERYLFALGWMIVHAIWQVAGVGLLLWVTLLASRQKSAAFKYRLSISALVLISMLALGTFIYSIPEAASTTADMNVLSVAIDKSTETKAEYLLAAPSDWMIVSKRIENWIPTLVQVWFLGAMLFLVKLGTSLADIRNLRHKKHEPADHIWQEILENQLRSLRLGSTVKLLKSIHIDMPMTYGVWKPVILIPAGLFFQLSPQQLEAIIAHELAHIKRHDYLVNLLQSFLEIVFFFHPIFWWINKIAKEQRENACDDLAIKMGIAPKDLAYGLANVLNHAKKQSPEMAMAATGRPKNPTLDRIKRIMGIKPTTSQPTTLTTMTMMTTLMLGATLLVGASDKTSKESFDDLMATELNLTTIEGDWTSQYTSAKSDTIPPKDSVRVYLDWDKMSPEQQEKFKKEMEAFKDMGVFFKDMKPLFEGLADMGGLFKEFPVAPFSIEGAPIPPFEFSMPQMEFEAPLVPLFDMSDMPQMDFDFAPAIEFPADIYFFPDTANGFGYSFQYKFDTTKMSKAEIEKKRAERQAKYADYEKKVAEAMEKWNEANKERIEEWQKKNEAWEKELAPKVEEFQAKMKAWEQENQPRIEEFQKKMEEWQKANQPKMEEFQRRMEAWQQENQVKMEQFQRKMEAWQREHQQQLQELQRTLQESTKKGGN
ncbi:M48 family metalloprotease [Mariniradius sp. RY-2]|uniref:M48 family metalloprotease n=2 Tax=Mariniradius sediminis TaxID=2909237 RepID=A0ABS9BW03_9BACT|nr:M48 family metalloprotease [Mariniradius sediminis]